MPIAQEAADPTEAAPRPVIWRPQPGPQKALVDCPITEILFGGARGGGKTDGILGKWGIKALKYRAAFNAVFFRKEMPQQDDLIERAKEIYLPIGGKWQEQKKLFLMPAGGRIRFRPLESKADADKYQGQNISDAAVEEAGNYEQPDPIDRLYGCLRSRAGVPVQMINTANPGGPGHQWIKQRYIDPAPLGMQILTRDLPNGATHRAVYIPSRVTDNRILLANDPGYVDRLHLVGSPNLVRAWLEGDWNVIEGAYFPEFSGAKHVIAPFEIPKHWYRIRAMDWGSARPFCVLWFAVSDGTVGNIPRGALVCYREWYGWNGQPNIGCKMTAAEVGAGIRRLEADDPKGDEVLDPAAFAQDGGPSIAERLGLNFRPADNARVARSGAMGGWDQVRERLIGFEGRPMLYLFSTITHLIRTLPALQHDDRRAEDVDSDGEDHAADTLRYACMARPFVRDAPNVPAPRFDTQLTVNELIKRAQRKRLAE
jgi:hypothetical protein